MSKIKLYRTKFSTNVERVALAMAYKGLEVESIWIDSKDRSEVRKVSGQNLVPVISDQGRVISDSTEIIKYLDWKYTQRPLYPRDPSRRAEMEIFIDWFNRVWKRPPNEIVDEMEKSNPDPNRIQKLGSAIQSALNLFEGMLKGRAYLMGEFSAADCSAFPFLKYAVIREPGDDYLFHEVLIKYMPLGNDYPNLTNWIRRIDAFPRA